MTENIPNYSDFKDCLVAFIDVLGFNQRVKSIKDQNDFIELGTLLYSIKLTAEAISTADGILDDLTITSISDSIIVSSPFTHPACTIRMLHILHHIQYELLATSFRTLVRGYICRGTVYHKDGIVFGSGYSDAYKGEGVIGCAPRIVLDPEVVKDGKRVIENYTGSQKVLTAFDYLREDNNDGFYFIDYLKPVGNQSELPKEQLLNERANIDSFIKQSLQKYQGDYSIYPKYRWLQNYYNNSGTYFDYEKA